MVVFLLVVEYHLSSEERAGRTGRKLNQVTDGLMFETRVQLLPGVLCSRGILTAGVGCSSTAAEMVVSELRKFLVTAGIMPEASVSSSLLPMV